MTSGHTKIRDMGSASESGGEDGICTANTDDITSLVRDTEDEVMLKLLSKNQSIKL